MHSKKIVILVSLIFLIPLVLFLILDNISRFAPDKPPKDFLIQSNFVDINKIDFISKYRSCQGHVQVPRFSSERSNMKHYFYVKKEFLNSNDQVEIKAPFGGRLLFMPTGEIFLFPASDSVIFPLTQWFLDFDHTKKLASLKNWQSVKKGDVIAYFDPSKGSTAFDVLVAVLGIPPRNIDNWTSPFEKLGSVFNYMSDSVFAEYKRGKAENRSDYIISKDFRDAHPCVYENGGPQFAHTEGANDTIYFTKERH